MLLEDRLEGPEAVARVGEGDRAPFLVQPGAGQGLPREKKSARFDTNMHTQCVIAFGGGWTRRSSSRGLGDTGKRTLYGSRGLVHDNDGPTAAGTARPHPGASGHAGTTTASYETRVVHTSGVELDDADAKHLLNHFSAPPLPPLSLSLTALCLSSSVFSFSL